MSNMNTDDTVSTHMPPSAGSVLDSITSADTNSNTNTEIRDALNQKGSIPRIQERLPRDSTKHV